MCLPKLILYSIDLNSILQSSSWSLFALYLLCSWLFSVVLSTHVNWLFNRFISLNGYRARKAQLRYLNVCLCALCSVISGQYILNREMLHDCIQTLLNGYAKLSVFSLANLSPQIDWKENSVKGKCLKCQISRRHVHCARSWQCSNIRQVSQSQSL